MSETNDFVSASTTERSWPSSNEPND